MAMNRWLMAKSIGLLLARIGLVFIAVGLLKFTPGTVPIEGLAGPTAEMLSLGVLSPHAGMIVIGLLGWVIALSFIAGTFRRVGVWLMGAQMLGAMSPLLLFPGELFSGPAYGPTLEAQYIIKDVILVAAGLLIAAKWAGARILAEPTPFRTSLRDGAPRLSPDPVDVRVIPTPTSTVGQRPTAT